uniref:Uncharacterized protein n=1 Tax=Trichuris muris TaxID=70415 RepID=A0A5S6QK66_TRIMR
MPVFDMTEQFASPVLNGVGHDQTCQPNDILDLEQLDPGGDDFTWLYACPSVSNSTADVVAWLRSESGSLSFETKRSLLNKLESLQAHDSFAGLQNGVEASKQKAPNDDVVRILPVASRAQPAAPLRVNEYKEAEGPKHFVHADGLSNPFVSSAPRKDLAAKEVHPEASAFSETNCAHVSGLSSDLRDVQLLASIQEDDLRQCLENLKLSRRRATVPDSATNNATGSPFYESKRSQGVSSAAENYNVHEVPKLGVRHLSAPCNVGYVRKHLASVNAKPLLQGGSKRPAPPACARSATPRTPAYAKRGMAVHPRYPGLQKSLPNLSIVRTMEATNGRPKCPPSNETCNGTASQGDLSHSSSSLECKGGNVPPKMTKPLRHPSRLPTPVKTGIPLLKSSLRKCPTNEGLPPLTVCKDRWNDGCF